MAEAAGEVESKIGFVEAETLQLKILPKCCRCLIGVRLDAHFCVGEA